jgi:hypothetical protein
MRAYIESFARRVHFWKRESSQSVHAYLSCIISTSTSWHSVACFRSRSSSTSARSSSSMSLLLMDLHSTADAEKELSSLSGSFQKNSCRRGGAPLLWPPCFACHFQCNVYLIHFPCKSASSWWYHATATSRSYQKDNQILITYTCPRQLVVVRVRVIAS